MKHILSLGAGVQSSTMALMAAHREITPMPLLAIFADTGWEPKAVYAWLEWLKAQLPFPVVTVSSGNIRHDQVNARIRGRRTASLPYFVHVDGQQKEGKVRRQCTAESQIAPIETYIKREILCLKPRQRAPKSVQVVQWRGMSSDEIYRLKPSRRPWMDVRYPLAMELAMSRNDCLLWMERHGYPPPPRSACIGCPFHSNDEWRRMRDEAPAEWDDAVEFDGAIRKAVGMRGDAFLHRSLLPLDLAPIDDRSGQLDMFQNECEGMCGV